jgi:gliding motility-associated protein GldM
MALPKEPRQKMINLMYLVLTALLALNVSAEIINAFKVVDNSLKSTNSLVNQSTETILKSLEDKLKDEKSSVKAAIWKPKADAAISLTKKLNDELEAFKMSMMKAGGYDPANGKSTFKEDNVDIATRIMEKEGGSKKLEQLLAEYKKAILAIDPAIATEFGKNLPLATEVPASNFRMMPTVAALTMLSKYQNDVKTTENKVVNFCHNQVGQVVVRFDAFEPIVGSSSNYLFPGQELQITAGLGAFSSTKKPTVIINGSNIPLDAKGIATSKFKVGSTSGSVKVKVDYLDQDGIPQSKTIDVPYTVGTATGAFVSAEKVKVLYIGLDNELAVSGGNVGDEKVSVSINNGSLSKIGAGRYVARPSSPGKAVVTVSADGKPSSFEFRVKNVPDPTGMVGASKGGRMQSNVFKAQQGVRADLENFVFEGVQFTVTGYVIYLTGAGFPDPQFRQVNGNSFAPVQDLINKAKPGTTIVVDEIRAAGPGGTRKIPAIVFNLF